MNLNIHHHGKNDSYFLNLTELCKILHFILTLAVDEIIVFLKYSII